MSLFHLWTDVRLFSGGKTNHHSAVESFAVSSFPAIPHTPMGAHTWPQQTQLFLLMSTPLRHIGVLNAGCSYVSGFHRRLLKNNRTKSISYQWKVPYSSPLTSLDLSDNKVSTSFQINVAPVRWTVLSSRWSRQETAQVCLGSESWQLTPSSWVLVCCSCDKITRAAECKSGFVLWRPL